MELPNELGDELDDEESGEVARTDCFRFGMGMEEDMMNRC